MDLTEVFLLPMKYGVVAMQTLDGLIVLGISWGT